MDCIASHEHAIMTVTDREMEFFMRVTSMTDDSVMILDQENIVGKEGKIVKDEGVTSVSILFVAVGLQREIGRVVNVLVGFKGLTLAMWFKFCRFFIMSAKRKGM